MNEESHPRQGGSSINILFEVADWKHRCKDVNNFNFAIIPFKKRFDKGP